MQLKHIKEEACPVCGCTTIIKESLETSDGKIRLHCNGEQWEHRTFICGQEIDHIPGAKSITLSTYNVCTNNEEYKNAQKKREAAKKELMEFISKLDTIEKVKNYWKQSIY